MRYFSLSILSLATVQRFTDTPEYTLNKCCVLFTASYMLINNTGTLYTIVQYSEFGKAVLQFKRAHRALRSYLSYPIHVRSAHRVVILQITDEDMGKSQYDKQMTGVDFICFQEQGQCFDSHINCQSQLRRTITSSSQVSTIFQYYLFPCIKKLCIDFLFR